MLTVSNLIDNSARPPITQQGSISSFVETIDKEKAEGLILTNAEMQRALSNVQVGLFAKALELGEFFDGSTIRFAWDGKKYHLVDGQHRIEAVIKSGIPATFNVVVACEDPRPAYAKQDSIGRKRTLANAIQAMRQETAEGMSSTQLNAYTAALKVILTDFPDRDEKMVVSGSLYKMFDEYLDARRIIESAPKMHANFKTRGIYKATVYAVALVTARYAEEKTVRDFWGQVVDDNGLMRDDPRKKLNQFLSVSALGGGSMRLKARIAATKCWNAFVAGRQMKMLKFTGRRIKIALTPYPTNGEDDSED